MPRFLALSPIIVSLIILFVAPAPAQAGKKEEIELLQQQVAALQQQVSALSQNTGQNIANTTVKISNLEQENQRLTGEIESLRYQLKQTSQQVDTLARVLAGDNFSGLETGLPGVGPVPNVDPNANPASGPYDLSVPGQNQDASAVTAAGPLGAEQISLPLDSDAAYEYASGFLLSGDYDRARQAFELYIEAFPNARQTPDARFRLGEIYLATGANAQAAQAFINHIKLYPNDPRAPEAYLKLGTAFSRLEQTDQACSVFKQVRTKFPNAAPIILQRTDLEMKRINCR